MLSRMFIRAAGVCSTAADYLYIAAYMVRAGDDGEVRRDR